MGRGTVTIRTDRLTLRRYRIEDAPSAFKNYTSDERVTEFLRWDYHKDSKQTRNLMSSWILRYDNLDYYHWGIDYKGEIIGGVSLDLAGNNTAEIGYCLGYEFWGQGLAGEAVAAVVDFAFNKTEIKELFALTFTENKLSQRLLFRVGFLEAAKTIDKYTGRECYSFRMKKED